MEQVTSHALSDGGRVVCHKAWVPPPNGYWKLNFAGYAVGSYSKLAGVGCLLRDEYGVFMSGLTKPINNVPFDRIELCAFSQALCFALLSGLDYVEIEGDAPLVYGMLMNVIPPTNDAVARILNKCRALLEYFKGAEFRVVRNSENEAATMLATLATGMPRKIHWKKNPPIPLITILNEDVIGRYYQIPS